MIAFILIASAMAASEPALEVAQLGRYELAYPFPSSDEASLAFQANFDGRWQLYWMDLPDGAVRRLHVSPGDDTHPAISPDGSSLAFISNRDGNDELYLLDLATGTARSVAPHPGKDGHPKWSVDGAWLVFNRTFDPTDRDGDIDSAILRVRPDGSGLSLISDSPNIETFASFSPDGSAVAFVEWFPGSDGAPAGNGDVVVVELATGARRNLTRSPQFDGYAYWGWSGDWIYYSTAVDGPRGREAAVHRVRADGSGAPERLMPLDGTSEVRAVPNAAETALYFNRDSDGRVAIHRQELKPSSR